MWERERSRGLPVPRLRTVALLALLGAVVWAALHSIREEQTREALFDRDAGASDRIRSIEYWAAMGRDGLPQLVEGLNHPDLRVRRNVVMALQRLGMDARDAAPALTERLNDEDARVRAGAIAALQRMGMIEPIRADLDQLLGDEEDAVRNATGEALLKSRGPEAVSDLVKVARSPDPLIRVRAVRLLSKVAAGVRPQIQSRLQGRDDIPSEADLKSRARIVEAVQPLLRDEDAEVRREAHRVLLDLSALTLEESIAALRDSDGTVVELGLAALTRHGEEAAPAVRDLLPLLERNTPANLDFRLGPANRRGRHATVRQYAVRALASIGPSAETAIPELIRIVPSSDEHEKLAIAQALIRLGAVRDEIVPILVELTRSSEALCREAGRVLLEYDSASASQLVRELAGRLKSEDPKIRKMAAEGLEALGPVTSEVTPALIDALGSSDRRIHSYVAVALAANGPRASSAVPALLAHIEAYGASASAAAINALGAIGPDAAPAVPKLLQIAQDSSAARGSVRDRAIWALGRIGVASDEVLASVQRAAGARSDWTRAAAIEALGRLGADRPEVFELVARALEDEEMSVRSEAIRALVRLNGNAPIRVEALRRALDDGHSHVRLLAVFALARLGRDAKAALPDLRALRTDPVNSARIPEPFLIEEDWPAALGPKRAISVGDAAAAAIDLIENDAGVQERTEPTDWIDRSG